MTEPVTTQLRECIARYQNTIPELAAIAEALSGDSPAGLIERYEQCYPLLEHALWNNTADFDELLDCYQSLHREQEALIGQQGDNRYHFILGIPVADRPAHLQDCLDSILQLCEKYAYGGKKDGVYQRIKIVVAEDSREEKNIQRHLDLIEEYNGKGLQVFHFGQQEQYELMHALPDAQLAQLGNLLTTLPRERFYLKGQAANRNLSYLKCLQLTGDRERTLYYMVDSDQSFCVNRMTDKGEESVYALDYFHAIERIFRTTDTLMVTGKLVGDPPVSPSVMAANFLDDVAAFFSSMAAYRPDEACRFHALPEQAPGDAAYHDLAGLFGFEHKVPTYPYRCRIEGEHDHTACLQDFSRRLSAFFSGEHLTRKTYFSYNSGYSALTPARTIYPGNYIVNYAGLKYIIPFGHLRLRMSGPTAGRLVAAEIGPRFASINMPHQHGRISGAGLEEDFRPGVELVEESEQSIIDLSNEYERQFFGDLMLFTSEELVKRADVSESFPEAVVREVIREKENEMLELYRQKQQAISKKVDSLEAVVFEQGGWWLDSADLGNAMGRVRTFIDTIRHNFSETSLAWKQIQSDNHREQRKQQIIEALMNYRTERDAWDSLFS